MSQLMPSHAEAELVARSLSTLFVASKVLKLSKGLDGDEESNMALARQAHDRLMESYRDIGVGIDDHFTWDQLRALFVTMVKKALGDLGEMP